VKTAPESRKAGKLLVQVFTGAALAALLTVFLATSARSVNRIDYHIEPEYERTMDRVVLSVATNTRDLSLHSGIIQSLPDYTEILMLLPEKKVSSIRGDIETLGQQDKVRLLPFDSWRLKDTNAYVLSSRKQRLRTVRKTMSMPSGSIWAQDLFEVVSGEGGINSLLMPYMHKWFIRPGWGGSQKVLSDNIFVNRLLSPSLLVKSLPVVFKGGNVLIDSHRGRRIAFSGGDVIRDTMIVSEETLGKKVSESEVVELLRLYLNVDQVVVVGEEIKQPLHMFHLDQAMVLLPGGTAGVTRIVDKGSSAHDPEIYSVDLLLRELRSRLRELGYRIVDIEATVEDVHNYRYYVNGIPYVNRESGRREFLIPFFDSSGEKGNREIFKRNVSALEALGYRVIPVPTTSNERHGGIHCMVNVIS
jgi:hypothetical protein